MQIRELCQHLERIAPLSFQEDYDNSGLLVGNADKEIKGVLISLDCLEATVHEAMDKNCNLIVAHHPIVFSGIKRFNGQTYVERTVQLAIKHDIAIYAIHTNLDNVYKQGVNSRIAERLELKHTQLLQPVSGELVKLATYIPKEQTQIVLNALFAAGAGHIGNYSACSFSTEGYGTFKGNEDSQPVVGEKGLQHTENEQKIEVILRSHQQAHLLQVLRDVHPYEEVAYEFYPTNNPDQSRGSGMIGELPEAMDTPSFLAFLKERMQCPLIRHTKAIKSIKKVAVCGGSGSFLLPLAKARGADVFVSADFKYHQFFDAEGELMICDIGHHESEKFTIDLLYDILTQKFTTFAVLKTEGDSNPINYFH